LGIAWRRKGHSLGFGIGIASGYATLGQIGFERRREYSATGSIINLASRLCGEARAGQIVISQRAFGSVEECVEAALLGELNLKGFNRPMPAYEVLRWREQAPCATELPHPSSGRAAQ
jgi:adenylate cyclase